jgi:hypothetical protein
MFLKANVVKTSKITFQTFTKDIILPLVICIYPSCRYLQEIATNLNERTA